MVNHFIPQAVSARPLLLMLDGHSSHYQPELVRFAQEHDIVLFCLPPHTTHESQPLDTAVFGPLKKHWRDVCHEYIQEHPGRVISKYQFSPLLNKAWMSTMTPANICSGFRTCGIHPFNRNAIKIPGTVASKVSGESGESGDSVEMSENDKEANSTPNPVGGEPSFTPEEEKLYETRYEEGYNIFDAKYIKWLELNHPSESLDTPPDTLLCGKQSMSPSLVHSHSADDLGSSNTFLNSPQGLANHQDLEMTVSDHFDNIIPEAPLLQPESRQPTPSGQSSCSNPVVSKPPATPASTSHVSENSAAMPQSASDSSPISQSHSPGATGLQSSSGSSASTPISKTISPASTLSSTSTPGSSGELRYISKYLVQYVSTPKTTQPVAKRVSGARVLTSAQCAAILEEREEKKRKEQEQKERRKEEREQKKKEREENLKRKAEEKARKAEEKERKRKGRGETVKSQKKVGV